ncbi:interleukin-3 receptor class 2 subunit beta-like [Osmerus eperlanus]|uniref:interleukin-3 receptor class 2 subunit beta-like n=1 Tax=Osmerus eperlanus TaxID=29151 RepID=UPI002E16628D
MGTVKETVPLLWVACGLVLSVLGLACGQDVCGAHKSTEEHVSPVLESLKCHNDYQSRLNCSWTTPNTSALTGLTLHHWASYKDSCDLNKSLCQPYREIWTSSGQRTVHCSKTLVFGAHYNHAFFFKPSGALATPPRIPLSQHVRARAPAELSEQAEEGGGRLLHWASPYPPPVPPGLQPPGLQPSLPAELQDPAAGLDGCGGL